MLAQVKACVKHTLAGFGVLAPVNMASPQHLTKPAIKTPPTAHLMALSVAVRATIPYVHLPVLGKRGLDIANSRTSTHATSLT